MIILNSLVNEKRGFVLWWHAKAGCTSLKSWYMETMGQPAPELLGSPMLPDGTSVHGACENMPHYNPKKHANLIHFTVVRNPLPRLVSHFRQQIAAQPQPGWRAGPAWNLDTGRAPQRQYYCTFREYVGVICSVPDYRLESHVHPYSHTLKGLPSVLEIHLEEIDQSWPDLLRALGLLPQPLAWRMPTIYTTTEFCGDWLLKRFPVNVMPQWQCYYDTELQQQVREKYHEDFERFYPAKK